MGKKYNLVIWDVDGTLLDTSEGIIAASRYTIEKMGLEVPSNSILKTFIGPPIQKSFAKVFGVTDDKAQEMASIFRSRYKDYDLLKAVPYDGILSLVNDLSMNGIKQAVATYKRQDYAEKVLDYFGFSGYMSAISGSDFSGIMTKKDIIEKAIEISGIMSLPEIVMIGDTDNDQNGAYQLGIDFIAVTYGFGFKEIVVDNRFKIAHNVDEIRNILKL